MLGGGGSHKQTAVERAGEKAQRVDSVAQMLQRTAIDEQGDMDADYFVFRTEEAAQKTAEPSPPVQCPYARSTFAAPVTARGLMPWQTLERPRMHAPWISWTQSLFTQRCMYAPAQVAQPVTAAPTTVENTAEESKCNPQEETGALAETARGILAELAADDDAKLHSSRFVAYLRSLAGEEYLSPGASNRTASITGLERAGITEADVAWEATEKPWRTHAATGYGYAQWARGAYGDYVLERVPDDAASAVAAAQRAVESSPDSVSAWLRLGLAHQADEMDAMAIPALYRAADLRPQSAEVWLALASSLANESCVPDALDAIRSLVAAYLLRPEGDSLGTDLSDNTANDADDSAESLLANVYGNANRLSASGSLVDVPSADPRVQALCSDSPAEVAAALERAFPDACAVLLDGPRRVLSLAASIVQNMARQHARAATLLQTGTRMNEDWAVQNRLGATMANAGDFAAAESVYGAIPGNARIARVCYNRGIAQLCLERPRAAVRSFVRALETQDGRYVGRSPVWDALRVAAELCADPMLTSFVLARDTTGLSGLSTVLAD